MAHQVQDAHEREGPRLSPREAEVTRLVAEGLTNHQIARELGLRETTVKNYVANAMHKAGVDNRTSLAVWFRDQEAAAD